MNTLIFRYVRHERVQAYLLLGWYVASDMGHVHGEWSVLMCWPCGCAVREPRP